MTDRFDHIETARLGELRSGQAFRFQPGGEGTTWGVFTFREYEVTPAGGEHVWCYGGDPDPNGHRQWRAFHADAVRDGARALGRILRRG